MPGLPFFVIGSITVEKTTVKFPTGVEVVSVECEDDPEECCGSGSGSGSGASGSGGGGGSGSSGSGSGSGSSGGGTPVLTDCCPNTISQNLTTTFTGGSTDPNIGLAYNSVTGKWEGSGLVCGKDCTVTFVCNGSDWTWRADRTDASGFFMVWTNTATSCSPFVWEYVGASPWADGGTCTGVFTITVTE